MRDVSYLKGSCVRDRAGGIGRIMGVTPSALTIGWEIPDTSAVRQERLGEADERLRTGIEILTLNAGWQPLAEVLGLSQAPQAPTLSERGQEVVSELEHFLSEWEPSTLGPSQNPFKRKKVLGPGPKGDTNRQAKKWSCSGADYSYSCVGIAPETRGRSFSFTVDPAKKAAYNKRYKRWRRGRE
jgi:hypothetical protein